MWLKTVIFSFYVLSFSLADDDNINDHAFPDNFLFGAATSSIQIEGGWNEDGKGESIWDHIIHTRPTFIANNDTADIACDSYHKYKEDVALLKNLGVNHYRFSISWPRILPTGFANTINLAGVAYYKNLIKELKDNGIEPLITLYHWDLPQPLQDIGGWPSDFIIDVYAEYARLCFELFGDDVKYWLTFNEPKQTCYSGYGIGGAAPAIAMSGIADYLCAHNILRAHAKAWHIYDEEFRSTQKGQISITLDTAWYEPESNTTDDEIAAERKLQFEFGWFANPIFNGNYPEVMMSRIDERSFSEGFNESRLPVFTQEELAYIHGTHDFLGLNTYTAVLVQAIPDIPIGDPSFYNDVAVHEYQPSDWEGCSVSWLKITPWGVRKLLNWIKETYNDPDVFITENGVAEDGSSLNDTIRVNYYRDYLSNIRSAMEDGVNVIGYTAWSLLDNFEFNEGYNQKFGIYHVDFNSPNRTRLPKSSVEYYKKIVQTHCLVDTCKE